MDNNYNIPYPELYYRIYPKVIEVVNKNIGLNAMDEVISQDKVDNMINEVYEEMLEECPEIGEDPIERRQRSPRYRAAQRPLYGRGRLLRDIISIILISELLRRRNPYNFYGPGYGYGPGY